MDTRTLTRYHKIRRENPLLPATHALEWARASAHAGDDWREARGHQTWTREVEGFTVTLREVSESIYPKPGDDGLGDYAQEARDDYGEWQGAYPAPAATLPLGLPYTAFRYSGPGWTQGEEPGYFIPANIEEEYDALRKRGQSRSVAWDMMHEYVKDTLDSFFSAPLTYCVLEVTVSREGVDLASEVIGTSYVDDDDGRGDIFTCVEEHGLIEEAISEARATLDELGATAIPSDLRLSFMPNAIREHFEGDTGALAAWVAQASDAQLQGVGRDACADDVMYAAFHRALVSAVEDAMT